MGRISKILTGDLPSPLDPRSAPAFLKSKLIDDPYAEQYVPRLVEVARGHFVAEHDPVETAFEALPEARVA